MTEITQAEWERRKAALSEALAAVKLPAGARVKHVEGWAGVVVSTGVTELTARRHGGHETFTDVMGRFEVIDEPEWPKWLRQGMAVVVPGDREWSGTVVGDPTGGGQIAVALHPTGERVKYRASSLKPYVPKFKLGDRVTLATTGDVGVVEQAYAREGTVSVRWKGLRCPVSAHLLTKLDEPS